ncbi:hypothetical protein BO83DRAFT_397986 [Aspergillus eucalypticola CBS 122712]|uniref:Altered inheritance of mitochondria protein 9, mitochondrial n=1 Tax=Aspergillus eucalypticola (strain CBS 122712 / IBT 29274) TaxID=1448314 RepID=A0A317VS62_ASPEC|nr:uncharacterized protein BO83DRAFT_397986 [Aspergillus eucalypticola CBS 122712]PWY75867.1 hypothetical protein BO83DRAFT_397986 [Aspergillus eucalypticola CBS 122712]
MSKRYVKFGLDALCALVSALPHVSSPISRIDKMMEEGFNKNGKEVIAKLPCPRVVPPQHSTASEAAVMKYVRSHTSVPVSEASNPVGSEYILMERACGRQLVEVWGEMNQLQQFRLVQCLVQLQSQLAALEVPAYGNMYFLPSDWPSFLAPPDGYEIAFAISEREQALLSKCYEASLVKNHMRSYLAMTQVDSAIRYLFMFTENTTKDGIIPLRDYDEGWISPQLDFEKVQARHAELFQLYIEKETEEISEEEARRLWFYLENT